MPSDVSGDLSVFDRFATRASSFVSRAWFIVTFLLVALLQNTQKRADSATQHKLNAIADGLSDLMSKLAADHPELLTDRDELRQAVGLERRESAGSRQRTH